MTAYDVATLRRLVNSEVYRTQECRKLTEDLNQIRSDKGEEQDYASLERFDLEIQSLKQLGNKLDSLSIVLT